MTGHAGFALDCYDFEPVDFLVKPINLLRLERAVGRIEKKLAGRTGGDSPVKQTKIGIHFEGGYQIISIDSIKYIEKKEERFFWRPPRTKRCYPNTHSGSWNRC